LADAFPVTYQSPKQVTDVENKRLAELKPIPIIPEDSFNSLSSYMKLCWSDARDFNRPIQDRKLSCAKRRKGEYSEDKLASIQERGGSEAYIRAVNTKCRAAYTNIYDIYNSINVKAWSISPTPVPSLPADLELEIVNRVQQEIIGSQVPLDKTAIMQLDERAHKDVLDAINEEAKKRAELMEKRIDDVLTEGGWKHAFNQCLNDLVTYPAAIMKGPILRRKPKKQWEQTEDGKFKLVVKDTLVWEFERVSPFDFYIARNIENTNDGYCFHRLRLNRRKLSAMKGIKGYNDKAIDTILEQYKSGSSGSSWLFAEDSQADGSPEGAINALEFWGEVQGQMLIDWGMSAKDIPDPLKEYQITAITIDDQVIRAVLNHNPLFKKPFHKVSWENIEGAFWGSGIPEIAADIDDQIQAIIRDLINNAAFASGPMLGIDKALLPPGIDIDKIIPWMIVALDSSQNMSGLNGTNAKLPIDWFQPEMKTQELLAAANAFMKMLDEYTGIPAYTYGISTGSNSEDKTASGLNMLMAAAGKIIANVASRVDSEIVESSIGMVYDNLMLYDPDDSIKGDCEIVAGGASAVIAKGQQLIRLMELLDRTRNDVDMQIIGYEGRAELLKRVFHKYELDLDDIIPGKEELVAREQANQVAINMAKTSNLDLPAPRNLDAAGSPVSGTDTAEMLQRTPVAQG
jgi:hypothetical protein